VTGLQAWRSRAARVEPPAERPVIAVADVRNETGERDLDALGLPGEGGLLSFEERLPPLGDRSATAHDALRPEEHGFIGKVRDERGVVPVRHGFREGPLGRADLIRQPGVAAGRRPQREQRRRA